MIATKACGLGYWLRRLQRQGTFGKYGGRELSFFGDLDVVFAWTTPPPAAFDALNTGMSPGEFFNAAADSVMGIMSEPGQGGRVFAMDARLRPHGRGAPLAVNIDTYVDYIHKEAETWELQALHRCRCAWGDSEALSAIRHAARNRIAAADIDHIERDIRHMRARLEDNTAAADGTIDIKRGAGGIVDVEFFVQAMAMQRPRMWNDEAANYFVALDTLDRTSELGALKDQYTFLREVENTWRLITGNSNSAVPISGPKGLALARAMHLSNAEELTKKLQQAQHGIQTETTGISR